MGFGVQGFRALGFEGCFYRFWDLGNYGLGVVVQHALKPKPQTRSLYIPRMSGVWVSHEDFLKYIPTPKLIPKGNLAKSGPLVRPQVEVEGFGLRALGPQDFHDQLGSSFSPQQPTAQRAAEIWPTCCVLRCGVYPKHDEFRASAPEEDEVEAGGIQPWGYGPCLRASLRSRVLRHQAPLFRGAAMLRNQRW